MNAHNRSFFYGMAVMMFGLVTLVGGVSYVASRASASVYEWLVSQDVLTADGSCCSLGEFMTVRHVVMTSGAMPENRAVYFGTSTSPSIAPDMWTQAPDCSWSSTVNNSVTDKCPMAAPSYHSSLTTSTTLWVRSVISYTGCGDINPNPDGNCGDTITNSFDLE